MRFLVGIVLIVVLVIFSVIFFSGGKNGSKQKAAVPKILPDYANTSAEVQLTTDGTINADQIHRSIIINVSNTSSTLEVVQGYQNNVIQTNTFPNNQDSFSKFLYALYNSNFTKARKTKLTNSAGVCPLGNRYTYELKNVPDVKDTSRWSTSCGGNGTFGGLAPQVRQLFQLQIPGYSHLTSSVSLSADQ
ncbi:MAG TPA: hypothetical protein VLF90_03920 [Patescibacteria group bacterium]|nr:hypothetical protein [Patescibacteria group bacterium]